jgi:hypothetical protein
MSMMRAPSRAAMLQTGRALIPISLPQPFRLPIANTHQSACVCDPQLLAPHTRQNFHSSQLPLAHLCPPQSDLLPEVYFRGTFLSRRKGDIIIEAQHRIALRDCGKRFYNVSSAERQAAFNNTAGGNSRRHCDGGDSSAKWGDPVGRRLWLWKARR